MVEPVVHLVDVQNALADEDVAMAFARLVLAHPGPLPVLVVTLNGTTFQVGHVHPCDALMSALRAAFAKAEIVMAPAVILRTLEQEGQF